MLEYALTNTHCQIIHVNVYYLYVYTSAKICLEKNIWKAQWKYLYLTFHFPELAWHQPQTSIVTLMQLSHVVLWAEMQFIMSEIKDSWYNVQECVIIIYCAVNRLQPPWYPSLHCESMKIMCVFNNSLLATRKICHQSHDNNLTAKAKCYNGVTQFAISCRLLSYRKSTSSV